MSMFRHLVVVSVSAALAELSVNIAANATPSFHVNNGSAEATQTTTVLTQPQHHLPSDRLDNDVADLAPKNANGHPPRYAIESLEKLNTSSFIKLPASLGHHGHSDRQVVVENGVKMPEKAKELAAADLPASLGHQARSNTSLSQDTDLPISELVAEIAIDSRASNSATNSHSDRKTRESTTRESQQQSNNSAQNSSTPSTQAQALPLGNRIPIIQNRLYDTPVPSYLIPNPNPLLFPTRPEEVDIEINQPLTLEQALSLARRNNRDLQVALLQLEQARQRLREARAALYPNLDFQGQAQSTRQSPQIDNEDNNANFRVNGGLQLNYNVYTGGRRDAQIQAAEEQVRLNQLEVERLSEQTRLDITNAYYDVQQADEQVRISEGAVRAALQSLRDAQALEQAGLGTRFDTLRAQVQLANENQNLIRARGDQIINRRQLAQILSLPQDVDITAADPVEIAGLWQLSLEESIVQAFQNRAELQQQLAQRNISQQQRRFALGEQRPQVSLFANYTLEDVFNDGVGLSDVYSVGARVSWNLFDGGAARARAAQQETEAEIAETRFANLRNQIRFQVEQAYNNLLANLQNIQTASVALEQATEALRLARLRFQAGVGTQTEVIDAENELTRAEGNRVRAILDYNRALATLQRSISNLSPTNAAAR